jgi:gliding motility-associated-like protein
MNHLQIIKTIFLAFLINNTFWFSNTYTQKLSMGDRNVLYICSDSTISAIGNNYGYKLGDGTNIERHIPVKVKSLQSTVSVNAYGSLALLSDGTVWQWSKDDMYSLHNIEIDSAIAISSGDQLNGGRFYCILKKDGSLWLWGDREEIAENTWGYKDSLEKMEIPKVIKVQGGNDCVIALCEDSTVWTWGFSKVEGNGKWIEYPNYQIWKPQKVNSLSKVVDIAAGGLMATVWALKDDGTVWEWGWWHDNTYPTKIEVSDVTSIFIGSSFNSDGFYTLLKDGTLCFFNSILWRPGRVDTITNIKDITCIASAGSMDNISTFLQDGDGNLWRWGDNSNGQLGNFTTFPVDSPEMMVHQCLSVNCDTITKDPDLLKLDTTIYPGAPITLKASLSDADLYWWYPKSNVISGKNDQEALVYITDETEFTVVIMDTYGCMRKERFILRKTCKSGVKITMDTITFPGAQIELQADEGTSYSWTPDIGLSCNDSSKTIATINDSITYTVAYIDTLNCPKKEKFIIRIRDCDTIIASPDSLIMDTLITPGSQIYLTASHAESYIWEPSTGLSCDTCQHAIARIYENTEYVVTLLDSNHCQWVERFRLTNYCDTSTMSDPGVIFDSVTYPDARLDLTVPISEIYSWQPSTGLSCSDCNNPIATVTEAVQYIVTLTDSFNCSSKYKFIIRIRDCDTIVLQDSVIRLDTTIYYTTEIELAASESFNGYQWNRLTGLSCIDCQTPVLIANVTSEYKVQTYNHWQCLLTEIFRITMLKIDVFVPNVFTPNNDGINDFFEVIGLTPHSTLKIFDSNATLIYKSDDYHSDWDGFDSDGKKAKEGTYWYILTIPETDTYKGWIYLKRD